MYSAVKSASGGIWGVLVVAEPASGEVFEEGAQEAFRFVFLLVWLRYTFSGYDLPHMEHRCRLFWHCIQSSGDLTRNTSMLP